MDTPLPSLIPTEKPLQTFLTVSLYDLPPDHLLVGESPSKSFIKSVSQLGVQVPILLKKRILEEDASLKGAYLYDVIDGRRRVKAARACGFYELNAVVTLSGDISSEILSLSTNVHRSSNKVSDLLATEALLDQGYTEQEIALGGNFSVSKTKAALTFRSLLPEIRSLFLEGKVTGIVAGELACFSRDLQQKALTLYKEKGSVKSSDLKVIRMAQREITIETLFPSSKEGSSSVSLEKKEENWREKGTRLLETFISLVPQSSLYNPLVSEVLSLKEHLLSLKDYGEEEGNTGEESEPLPGRSQEREEKEEERVLL